MANDVDAKGIGLSAKDILMGIVTVAAGATAGQPGAQGAQQIDKGLDGILGMAGVTKDPPPSRLNPEQADFAVRKNAIQKQTPTVQPVQVAQTPVQTTPVQAPVYREAVVQPPQPAPQPAPAIPIGVATELARLGYTDEQIAEIAAGRWQDSGQTRKGAEPQRLAQAEGAIQKGAEPKPGVGFEGFNVGSVLGVLKGLGQG
jgi:hypothetical protein